jgi:hypothetical protein
MVLPLIVPSCSLNDDEDIQETALSIRWFPPRRIVTTKLSFETTTSFAVSPLLEVVPHADTRINAKTR